MIVLDTNVVSELMRPSPAEPVRSWVETNVARGLRTTAITVAEIRYGIERLDAGKRKDELRQLASQVFATFGEQILAFDADAARAYAEVVVGRDDLGHPMSGFDAQIAAICHVHSAALATRNLADFAETGIELVDPWEVA